MHTSMNMASNDIVMMLIDQNEVDIVADVDEIANAIADVGGHEILFEKENEVVGVKKIDGGLSWCRSLEDLPTFTLKEIEKHRQLSGKGKKNKGLKITKTLIPAVHS